jgi:hypothetical protein
VSASTKPSSVLTNAAAETADIPSAHAASVTDSVMLSTSVRVKSNVQMPPPRVSRARGVFTAGSKAGAGTNRVAEVISSSLEAARGRWLSTECSLGPSRLWLAAIILWHQAMT